MSRAPVPGRGAEMGAGSRFGMRQGGLPVFPGVLEIREPFQDIRLCAHDDYPLPSATLASGEVRDRRLPIED